MKQKRNVKSKQINIDLNSWMILQEVKKIVGATGRACSHADCIRYLWEYRRDHP